MNHGRQLNKEEEGTLARKNKLKFAFLLTYLYLCSQNETSQTKEEPGSALSD